MSGVYYNEIDKNAVAWLSKLIAAGHLPSGDVDTRDIRDVRPDDLRGYTHCHFFAGIGGWPLALKLAGWPEDRPVWTGSCPCQPFSSAGRRDGFADERHLWPHWFHLIEQCQPDTIFGEQVASKDGLAWLDLVSDDLEGAGYALGAVDICAAGVGAPHIRQRLYWVAHASEFGQSGSRILGRSRNTAQETDREIHRVIDAGRSSGLADASSQRRQQNTRGTLGNEAENGAKGWHEQQSNSYHVTTSDVQVHRDGAPRPTNGFWRDADWLFCRDGRWRPVEPGTFPLAHGIPARVGRLRGYGNAIVIPVAQAFIEAYLECHNADRGFRSVSLSRLTFHEKFPK